MSPVLAAPQPSSSGRALALRFDERACFVAGPAKSGTTLLVALLDGHPDLVAFPEETAYFPTLRTRLGGHSRREQFRYLTCRSRAGALFGHRGENEQTTYPDISGSAFAARFEQLAFAPASARRDLLAIMLEAYAAVLDRPLGSIHRWVEKTPANRDHLPAIFSRFPAAKLLLTLRDPRALLSTQIQLERQRQRRRFSVYRCLEGWRTAARLAIRQRQAATADPRMLVVEFERLLLDPEPVMRSVCAFLEVPFAGSLCQPTKIGRPWVGNSATCQAFAGVDPEPRDRWRGLLSPEQIGWVEWHCRDLMEPLGYRPLTVRKRLRHWTAPIPGETPREYLKSRFYSLGRWQRS